MEAPCKIHSPDYPSRFLRLRLHGSSAGPFVPARQRPLYALARGLFPRRFRIVVAASRRPDRLLRHPARGAVAGRRRTGARWRAVSPSPHALLARCERCRSPRFVRRGHARVASRARRGGAGVVFLPGLGVLPVSHGRGAGLPRVPVGSASARGRLSGGLPGGAASDRTGGAGRGAVAGRPASSALAALPAELLIGPREARQRRSDLAQLDGALLPLRDAAAAALDRVVHAPAAGLGPDGLGVLAAGRRARGAVCDLRSSPGAPGGRSRARVAPDSDRFDRQLRLLQPPGAGPVRALFRRCGLPAALAVQAAGPRDSWLAAVGRAACGRRRASRHVRSLSRPGRRRDPPAGSRRLAHAGPRAFPQHERLRALRRDDDRAAGDRDRGQRRRCRMETLRISMEAWRCLETSPLRGAAPAPARLADVVRGPVDL